MIIGWKHWFGTIEPNHEMSLIAYAVNEGLDRTARSRSLMKAVVARLQNHWILMDRLMNRQDPDKTVKNLPWANVHKVHFLMLRLHTLSELLHRRGKRTCIIAYDAFLEGIDKIYDFIPHENMSI